MVEEIFFIIRCHFVWKVLEIKLAIAKLAKCSSKEGRDATKLYVNNIVLSAKSAKSMF
jgi:hypothetical protein